MKRNIKKIVGQMTLEEKAGMCSGRDFWHLKGVERLNIPSVMVSDGPHGLRKQEESADHLGINESIKAVCFPPAVLNACSFDRKLLQRMGETIGGEAQAADVSVVLGPAVNIKRSPLCGRNFEYYSEDPYLAGEAAAAFIQGVQSRHIGTSIKHFAANNQEYNRMSASSEVDERTLREIYLPAFETVVKKAQPYTVMCSYNQLNGVFASENSWLLTEILRNEWGFEGYVVSDWGAVNDRVSALKAGLDLEMPASGGIGDREIVDAVQKGHLDEKVLDQAVERILKIVFLYEDHRKDQAFLLERDHVFSRKIAEESMVLLKNEGVLPLKKEEKTAFIGEFAEYPRFQGGGSSHINAWKISSALSALDGNEYVAYAKGFTGKEDFYDEALAAEAVRVAKNADKAVIFAGLPESFESEGYDRNHMRLPACQNRLIHEIAAVQPNTVVVLHNGAPVEMPWLDEVKGVLEAYLGGEAVGEAVVDILYGKVNPSGKLAETFPIKLEDNPSYLNFGDKDQVEYREGIFVGYRYYEKKKMDVAFPFGHGLSYTAFTYSNPAVEFLGRKENRADVYSWKITVDVTNTGTMAGKEVVQLYVRDKTGKGKRPIKELKGFEKVELQPGETKKVMFQLDKRSFAWYHTGIHDWYAASGDYDILIGASSKDIRQTMTVHLERTDQLPLHLHMNTTLGELMEDERTRIFGKELKSRMDTFFGVGSSEEEKGDTAVTDDMGDAVANSMPIRNLVSFGLYGREELLARLKKIENQDKKRAFIFDLDGVIVFTDKFHYQAWKKMADRMGIYFDETINNRLRGVSRAESLEIILERYDKVLTKAEKAVLMEEKNQTYRALLDTMTPEDVSGQVRDTLKRLREAGFYLAVGSSSKNAKFILEKVGLSDAFDAVSDGNNITHSKPDPEVFEKAAQYLGAKPEDCIVVEDAFAGIDAAKAAGMTAVGIGDASAYEKSDYHITEFRELLEIAGI